MKRARRSDDENSKNKKSNKSKLQPTETGENKLQLIDTKKNIESQPTFAQITTPTDFPDEIILYIVKCYVLFFPIWQVYTPFNPRFNIGFTKTVKHEVKCEYIRAMILKISVWKQLCKKMSELSKNLYQTIYQTAFVDIIPKQLRKKNGKLGEWVNWYHWVYECRDKVKNCYKPKKKSHKKKTTSYIVMDFSDMKLLKANKRMQLKGDEKILAIKTEDIRRSEEMRRLKKEHCQAEIIRQKLWEKEMIELGNICPSCKKIGTSNQFCSTCWQCLHN
jgi:hypothetical protein